MSIDLEAADRWLSALAPGVLARSPDNVVRDLATHLPALRAILAAARSHEASERRVADAEGRLIQFHYALLAAPWECKASAIGKRNKRGVRCGECVPCLVQVEVKKLLSLASEPSRVTPGDEKASDA